MVYIPTTHALYVFCLFVLWLCPSCCRRYLNELYKLRLTDARICKVTKHRIFSVAVHPTTSQLVVAAGDKWGGVGIWNIVSVYIMFP